MLNLKKILVNLLIVAYPLALQADDVLAKRTSSRSSKKSSKKKRTASKKRDQVIETNENSLTSSTVEETTTNTNISETSNNQVAASESVSVETTETTTQETSEIKDMSKDAKWEDFRICMQTSCAGSDEQPSNVECYKSVTFDNVFGNCKMLVEENKREDFKKYFTGSFIKAEKKAFCEGSTYEGKFDDATQRCAISVKYTRPAYNGKQYKCGSESKSLTWYLDNKNYVCDANAFGVGECYEDSPGYASSQVQKYTGIVQMGVGLLAGVASAISNAKAVTKQEKNADGSYQAVEQYNKNGKVKKDWATGVSAGIATGSGLLESGATGLATGLIMEKERGNRIFGVCNLPNGTVISEGNSIKLSW